MTWNHRVIRKDDGGETWYEIHECFYDDKKEDDIPTSWTVDAIAPVGETPEELLLALQRMIAALGKPILVISGDVLVVASSPLPAEAR